MSLEIQLTGSISSAGYDLLDRTVKMMFRTHLTRQDSKELMVGKERMKEVVLEEHQECGCQCEGAMAGRCRGDFNQVTQLAVYNTYQFH